MGQWGWAQLELTDDYFHTVGIEGHTAHTIP